jgi:DNA/RNA-binding domain of Phe-tRNA-synthetase-like protein
MMTQHAFALEIDDSLTPWPAQFALIWAEGIRPPEPTEHVPEFLAPLLSEALDVGDEYVPVQVRQRVRKVLRYGKYKPSGRSKPASEFLLRSALGETFPLVNGPVDVNNAISLVSGFPGSIFDADLSGRHLRIRRGRPGETYVFNPSGQTIDLQDLLLVCREGVDGWEPCGNPVKDAMITKINPKTRAVVAVLYVPPDEPQSAVESWAQRYADLLQTHCAADTVGSLVMSPIDA